MARRYKILVCGLGGVIAVVAVCFFCLREREPSYNGRTLSQLMEDYIPFESPYDNRPPVRHYEATNAIAAIGKNAVPTLLRWNEATDPIWMPIGLKLWTNGFHPRWFGHLLWRSSKAKKRNYASIGFWILGTNGLPPLADLEAKFFAARTGDEVSAAQRLIALYDRDGFHFFLQVLRTNSDALQCASAARGFIKFAGSNPDKGYLGVEPLINFLRTEQPEACDAATALVYCQSTKLTVPALVKALGSTNAVMRRASVHALGMMGNNAYEAVPKIRTLLNDPDPAVNAAARYALQHVAPYTFKNDVVPRGKN